MKNCPYFHVKKRNLLAIAGVVWFVAGFNVARLGFISYSHLEEISILLISLTIIIFVLFGSMFYKMSTKHHLRIQGFKEYTRPFWHFFDLKSYVIMGVMMSGGIGLRSSGLVSDYFIAFFYTGLGLALTMAGILFWMMYLNLKTN